MAAGKGIFIIQSRVRFGKLGKKPSGKWVDTNWTWPDISASKNKAIQRRNKLNDDSKMNNEFRAVYRVGGRDSVIN